MNKKKSIVSWIVIVALSLCAALYALGVIAIPTHIVWDDGHGNVFSGVVEKGQWVGDVRIEYKDGSIYVGTLKNGQWDGYGKFISVEGWEFSGEFEEGSRIN